MSQPELAGPLQRLRLSGLWGTPDLRVHEAETEPWGSREFLPRLCEEEIQRRADTAWQRRVQTARFDQSQTLQTFDFPDNPEIPAAFIRDWATGACLRRQESIVLTQIFQ